MGPKESKVCKRFQMDPKGSKKEKGLQLHRRVHEGLKGHKRV